MYQRLVPALPCADGAHWLPVRRQKGQPPRLQDLGEKPAKCQEPLVVLHYAKYPSASPTTLPNI